MGTPYRYDIVGTPYRYDIVETPYRYDFAPKMTSRIFDSQSIPSNSHLLYSNVDSSRSWLYLVIMVISDFEFILPDFDIWAQGRGQSGVSQGSSKLKFSKHSYVIYCRKAFLMLISDFEFVLPDFGFLVPGERESTTTS